MTVGTAPLLFEAVPGWPQVPEEVGLIEAVGLAVNSRDEVFIFARADIPVLVFNSDGEYLRGWGDGQFVRPHGMWIAPDASLYLTDDLGHRVAQYSEDGELIRNIGPAGEPSPTGVEGMDYRTIQPGHGPFNIPTNLVTDSNNDLFITDGYGNARVHHFSASGELVKSWGEPGDGEGQFNVPHGIGIDDGQRLYVCDRENSRIQIFSRDGELLAIWTDVVRPCQAFVVGDLVYVAELGIRTGIFPWQQRDLSRPGGRVTIFDRDGNVLSRWGGGDDPTSPEDFYSPHDIYVDSQGSIYVAEVRTAAASNTDDETSGYPTLRKFVRAS